MPVVTIRGHLGSGAPEIGKLVADELHADYVDREIIAEVAATLRVQEQEVAEKEMPPGALLGRIREALGHSYAYGGGYPGAYLPAWEIPPDDPRYLQALTAVIDELAQSPCIVIRGRGSQFILKGYREAFHVLVVAPLEMRVRRVMESLKLDQKAAKSEIGRFDSSRRAFIKRYFQAELEDPIHHDLVINTERLSFEAAASITVDALTFKDRTGGGQP